MWETARLCFGICPSGYCRSFSFSFSVSLSVCLSLCLSLSLSLSRSLALCDSRCEVIRHATKIQHAGLGRRGAAARRVPGPRKLRAHVARPMYSIAPNVKLYT